MRFGAVSIANPLLQSILSLCFCLSTEILLQNLVFLMRVFFLGFFSVFQLFWYILLIGYSVNFTHWSNGYEEVSGSVKGKGHDKMDRKYRLFIVKIFSINDFFFLFWQILHKQKVLSMYSLMWLEGFSSSVLIKLKWGRNFPLLASTFVSLAHLLPKSTLNLDLFLIRNSYPNK